MVHIRTPSLMKRKGSDNWYFRQRIPQDVRRILSAIPRAQWPHGWGKSEIWLSTGTSVKGEARIRQGEFLADVERHLQAYRASLDDPALAISGLPSLSEILPRIFTEPPGDKLSGTPGEAGPSVAVGPADAGSQAGAMPVEKRISTFEPVSGREYEITQGGRRWFLIEAPDSDRGALTQSPGRNRDGDAGRIPPETKAPSLSFTALIEAWKANSRRRVETTGMWVSLGLRLKVFLGHDDLSLITSKDIRRWADQRLADGVSVSTVRNGDLAAFRSIFEFGTERDWLPANPTVGVKVRGPKKQLTRPKYFSGIEIALILNTALAVRPSKRFPKTASARRWVPWLCAYSGARVGEMLQLRKSDLRQEDGDYVLRITPDAGTVKTGKFRDVPLHRHLIEMDFVAFVTASADGHLFTDGTAAGLKAERERLRYMVRKVVKDAGVSPNHGWRHSFKTYGHQAGIDSLTLDAICGHAPKTEGDEYTHVTLKTMIEAMHKFPRYSL